MFFVYILHSSADGQLYTGFTHDLEMRMQYHAQGKVISTKDRRPLTLIYYEAYLIEKDAAAREIFLKSGSGKRYLKKQLARYFEQHAWK